MKKIYLALFSILLFTQLNVLAANNNKQPNYQTIINSVRAQKAIAYILKRLDANLLQ